MHGRTICTEGYLVKQCRCPGPKRTQIVACEATHLHTLKVGDPAECFDKPKEKVSDVI